jgi:hypothetical protein
MNEVRVLSNAALLKRYTRQTAKLQTELEKTKNRNKTYEVGEIESKLQEEQRRNELLQERTDLLKEQLTGSVATDSVGVDRRRALRRRTWCGHASRKDKFLWLQFCYRAYYKNTPNRIFF